MHGLRLENALGRDELGSLSVVESQIWPFCGDQKRAAGCQRGHRYTSAFMLSRSAVVFWMSRPRLTCSVGDIGKQRYRREVVEFWCSVSPAPAPARCVARGAMTKLRAFDTKFTLATVHCARPTNTSHAATLPSPNPNTHRIPLAPVKMSLGQPGVPLDAEHADNFEDIEKQFAVKGARIHTPERDTY
jgi:hypothetical protein